MRVIRTFAFLDLCGFTAYTDQHGDGAAVAILARLRSVLRSEAERHGVRVTKWLGDGAMLSGIEATSVQGCTEAVSADIRREGPLALRAGIASGPVIMFEGDDYIGASVNLAARLCGAAAPGQVLVAAGGMGAAEWERGMRPLPPMRLSGIPAAVQVCELASPLMDDGRPPSW